MTIRRLAAIMAADVVSYSAIMESDEEGTLTRLKGIQREIIQGKVLAHGGRIVKTMGDGFLAEFASPLEALKSAVAIQGEVAAREQDVSVHPMSLRMAINLGDILVDDDGDIFGDDVNIAARLQMLAEPGCIVVSGKVFEEVAGKLDCGFEDRGQQRVKNISRPIHVYAVRPGEGLRTTRIGSSHLKQEISFCRAPDGVRLAWAKVGHGPPLVKPGNWVGHLEDDWESPVWHHVLERLARRYTLIRHDSRGNGLSDWEVGELSVEAWVSDLESVVDAAGVARFVLLGISQGCAVSIA
ncbi:adenylate/guanylate cyclase domain-containing protein, partial [Microvirga yunnanensis]